jgi:hypothetical protein
MFYGGAAQAYVSIPQSYSRVTYSYPSFYDRRMDFMIPFGVDPATAGLFMQASAIFRQFDIDYSGTLDLYEWKRAMFALGYYMSDYDCNVLFMMIDTDRSGRIGEREFCEYWAYSRRSYAPPPMMAPHPVAYHPPPVTTTTTTYVQGGYAPAPYY